MRVIVRKIQIGSFVVHVVE